MKPFLKRWQTHSTITVANWFAVLKAMSHEGNQAMLPPLKQQSTALSFIQFPSTIHYNWLQFTKDPTIGLPTDCSNHSFLFRLIIGPLLIAPHHTVQSPVVWNLIQAMRCVLKRMQRWCVLQQSLMNTSDKFNPAYTIRIFVLVINLQIIVILENFFWGPSKSSGHFFHIFEYPDLQFYLVLSVQHSF